METVLVVLMDDLWSHVYQGGSVLLLLLDLTAAFPTVNYLLTHCLTDMEKGDCLAVVFLHSSLLGTEGGTREKVISVAPT